MIRYLPFAGLVSFAMAIAIKNFLRNNKASIDTKKGRIMKRKLVVLIVVLLCHGNVLAMQPDQKVVEKKELIEKKNSPQQLITKIEQLRREHSKIDGYLGQLICALFLTLSSEDGANSLQNEKSPRSKL